MHSLFSRGLSIRPSLFILFFIIQGFTTVAQVSLVKDINTKPGSLLEDNYYDRVLCPCNGIIFFTAENELGRELWRTDGTEQGTKMVIDLYKGAVGGVENNLKCFNNRLYFSGNNGSTGMEPWITDGTAEGTRLFKDLHEDKETSGPGGFVEFKGKLYFSTWSESVSQGADFWGTDGTSEGTTKILTIPNAGLYSIYADPTSDFFVIHNFRNNQSQFFKSDGTAAGTESTPFYEYPEMVSYSLTVGNKFYFASYRTSYELWVSDGTQTGTTQLGSYNSFQDPFTYQTKLTFSANGGTWISDGTEEGTIALNAVRQQTGVVYNNLYYGLGYDYETATNVLFQSDGTPGGTSTIATTGGNLCCNTYMPYPIPVINDQFLLPVFDAEHGGEPGISNRTSEGTHRIADIASGPSSSFSKSWITFNNKGYFIANDGIHGGEIWTTDGTEAGTHLVKDVLSGTQSSKDIGYPFHVLNDQLFFRGTADDENYEIYKISDTQEASLYHTFTGGGNYFMGKTNHDLFFLSENKVIKANGLEGGIVLVKDFEGELYGSGWTFSDTGIPNNGFTLGNKLIYHWQTSTLGQELWVTDGTAEGTTALKDINPGTAHGVRHPIGAILNDQLFFGANDGINGYELWKTDGTEAGTFLLKDINAGAGSSGTFWQMTLGNSVLFSAYDEVHGNELWKTDGTAEGTVLLKEIFPGPGDSDPGQFARLNTVILFTAFDEAHGWGLWKTDGTESGTVFVKDIVPGTTTKLKPTNLIVIGDLLFFSANDGIHGNELWVSNGTTEGTFMIDLVSGEESSNPTAFTNANGIAYFTAHGQLWGSDGTRINTSKIADISPFQMIYHEGWLYFSASTPAYGTEIYKLPVVKQDQTIDFSAVPVKVMGANPFDLIATATSLTPVIFSTGSEKISISNATAILLQPGSVTIHADQPGNVFYNPASRVDQTFCINPAQPVITSTADVTGAALLTSSAETGNEWFLNGAVITDATAKTFQASESGVYTVQVSIDECKSEVSADLAVIVTAADDNDGRITLSPNPVSNTLRIQSIGTEENSIIKIYSVSGQPMERFTLQSSAIIDHNVQGYAKGLYIVKISSAKGVSFSKFVKE